MKLIVLYNNYPATALNIEPLDVYTLPDTALLKDGKPLFIPDFADLCTVQTHLVVRICRLGRSISERFAHRYYDAITVGATFTAENLRQELAAAHRPWDLAVGFDGAAAVGKMIPLYENHPPQTNDSEAGVNQHFMPLSNDIAFSLQNNGTTIHEATSGMMLNHIDKVIAKISKHYTLRQGDLIFIDRSIASRPLQREEVLSVTVDNEELLYCKVK